MKRLALGLSLITILAVTLSFQNCGGFTTIEASSSSRIPVLVRTSVPGTSYSQMTGIPGADYSLRRGTMRADVNQCLTTGEACVFWRSPFATSWRTGSILADPRTDDAPYDSELQTYQLFSVTLAPFVANNSLRNSHFDVFYTDAGGLPQRLTLVNNRWDKSFAEGHSPSTPLNERFAIEQIQTFLNVSAFREAMLTDGSAFYASNGTIGIDTVSTASGYNVNFDHITNTIYSGIRFGQQGRYYTLAQSSELIIREVARANLSYANPTIRNAVPSGVYAIPCNSASGRPYFVTDGNNLTTLEGEVLKKLRATCGHSNVSNISIYNYCATSAGCWKAIELGQADFFTWVMFASLPSIGETALPRSDVRYYRKRSNIRRNNVADHFGVSFFDDFTERQMAHAGEVKQMSELFAEILFDVYANSATDRPIFLRTVSQFLPQISTASTFMDAKAAILMIDQVDFASRNGPQIRAGFEQRGYL